MSNVDKSVDQSKVTYRNDPPRSSRLALRAVDFDGAQVKKEGAVKHPLSFHADTTPARYCVKLDDQLALSAKVPLYTVMFARHEPGR